jgi:RNA polymerase sigma factor (sigma-70 family)
MMPTQMTDSANPSALQDESAVAAVRGGDAERYRELVERHERRVFAVAWSRLGDAALAEEATQEAFICAYRRLWLLGDGTKFSGWVNTIARRIAINSGLRHRRELNKRERWALENSDHSSGEHSGAEADPIHTPETLRQTLAELPAAHRECLVLFYLESKSGAEAALALGISEAALRVRLHRARAAMRERLEEKLEGSLANLRPSKTLAPAVMAGVLAFSTTKATAAGVGGTVLGVLAKFTPLKFLFSFFAVVPFLPGIFLQWLVMRLELRNFREREGFRARLFRDNSRRFILLFALMMLVIWTVVPWLAMPMLLHGRNLNTIYLGLAGIIFIQSTIMARRLIIIRNRYFTGMVVTTFYFAACCVAAGLGWIPTVWIGFCFVGQMILVSFYLNERPVRTDYNLFLRAVEGILKTVEPATDKPEKCSIHAKLELFKFARFLGSRWLANDFQQTNNGLVLRMTPVEASLRNLTWRFAYFAFRSQGSKLTLRWEGTVAATLHENDRRSLRRLRGENLPSNEELEKKVATAAEFAWQKFRAGDFAAAERALGQVPESDVFVRPQAKSLSTKLQRAFMIAIAVCLVIQMFKINELLHILPGAGMTLQQLSQQNLKLALHDLAIARNEKQRFDALGTSAKECFVAGEIVEARNDARELMTLLPKYLFTKTAGDAIQDANLVLGRIAVREGNIEAAKHYLIAAGKSPGSPVMDSFGPNMTLAKDLLEKDERDTVLEYFMLCRRFWKMDYGKLDNWMQEVMDGKTPDFGANLLY